MRKKVLHDYGVTCVIMGGGAGTRLKPLTDQRAKPAVPVGAKYRLIDIPISNCMNSGLNRIYVLTQFNSTSLHRHVSRTYHFDRFSRGFVEILAAQQSPQYTMAHSWYQGNADAVRKNLPRIRDSGKDEVLILSGDQLYRMDYTEVLATHRGVDEKDPSDATIAALLVDRERARSFGIMRIDRDGNVLEFVEKPGDDDDLFNGLEAPDDLLRRFAVDPADGPFYLANMGIYVFDFACLEKSLDGDFRDFGREVLPTVLASGRVRAHLFDGYWEDIGTIQTFHQANIDLARERPRFNFYSSDCPIYTRARLLPASTLRRASVSDALISEGCLIEDATIEQSLIGIRSVIGRGCHIRNTFVMGSDDYEDLHAGEEDRRDGDPRVGIGAGTRIEGAIIDKDVRIGSDVCLTNARKLTTYDDDYVKIRDGIIIVPRRGVVPKGYTL